MRRYLCAVNVRRDPRFCGVVVTNEVKTMKDAIHPAYEATTVTCACGENFETKSTRQGIRVEICSKCHPFFTGKQKLIDTGGRVDRFQKRFGRKEEK